MVAGWRIYRRSAARLSDRSAAGVKLSPQSACGLKNVGLSREIPDQGAVSVFSVTHHLSNSKLMSDSPQEFPTRHPPSRDAALPVTIVPGMPVIEVNDGMVGTVVGLTESHCIYRTCDMQVLAV